MPGRIEENETLLKQLMRHEGEKRDRAGCHVAYPAGALTIGYGHNLDARPLAGLGEGAKIDEPRARKILFEDVRMLGVALDRALPWWRKAGEARSAVLLNMAFNMGMAGVRAAVLQARGRSSPLRRREQRWKDARDGMLASKWAGQVGRRASELAEQMLTGQWPGGQPAGSSAEQRVTR